MGPRLGVKLRFRVRVCVCQITQPVRRRVLCCSLRLCCGPPAPQDHYPHCDCDRKRVGRSGWLVAHPGVGQALGLWGYRGAGAH